MAKSIGQKLKIMYVRDFLLENTDPKHPVTVKEIIDDLYDSHGIVAGRKSIYNDLRLLGTEKPDEEDTLEDVYGLDIVKKKDRYYIRNREFSLQEIKLLVDMVESSSNIPESMADSLNDKLKNQLSVHSRKHLERHIDIRNQVKELNEEFQKNADAVFEAIKQDKVLNFKYFKYNVEKKKELKHNGLVHVVSPFALVWADQNYYMLGYNHKENEIRAFRVDRMTGVTLTDEPRKGKKEFDKLTDGNLSAYINKLFHMFIGDLKHVTMRFDERLADTVVDRFGEDVMMHPDGKGCFSVTAEVAVSPQFYGWLAGFGSMAELVAPQSVRTGMKEHLEKAAALYK